MRRYGGYTARAGNLKFNQDMVDFLRRRTTPFLDSNGLDRPISQVLQEVYLQGIRDAVDVMSASPLPGQERDNG